MEVKYKNTNTIKTQIQVTYTERGNGVQMTCYIPPNHTYREFICVPFGLEVVCTRFNRVSGFGKSAVRLSFWLSG